MTTIDARNAVKSATEYLDHIKDLVGENFTNLRLEELEVAENGHIWMVTLGYDVPYTPSGVESLMTQYQVSGNKSYKREYKIFNVDALTGQVQSMKIRSV
jgi:hypothetical protein